MANELLMPTKYTGSSAGISVIVSNLDEACNYNKILISLEEREYEVGIHGDKTDVVTFNNLDQTRSYEVKALLDVDGEIVELNIKTAPRTANDETSRTLQSRPLGGCMSSNIMQGKAEAY